MVVDNFLQYTFKGDGDKCWMIEVTEEHRRQVQERLERNAAFSINNSRSVRNGRGYIVGQFGQYIVEQFWPWFFGPGSRFLLREALTDDYLFTTMLNSQEMLAEVKT